MPMGYMIARGLETAPELAEFFGTVFNVRRVRTRRVLTIDANWHASFASFRLKLIATRQVGSFCKKKILFQISLFSLSSVCTLTG